MPLVDELVYSPGVSVKPPSCPAMKWHLILYLDHQYKQPLTQFAAAASGVLISSDPLMTPGGNPVMAVPGLNPTSPLIIEGPVLVIVEPAIIAKGAVQSRSIIGGPDGGRMTSSKLATSVRFSMMIKV